MFRPQQYFGEAAFPWDGRIAPKFLIKYPWLLNVLETVLGRPYLISGEDKPQIPITSSEQVSVNPISGELQIPIEVNPDGSPSCS